MHRFGFGLRGLCLAASVLLVAACETQPEDTASTDGAGSAQQTTTVATTTPAPSTTTSNLDANAPEPGSARDLIENIGDRVYFGLDRFDLEPEARGTVERWAAWLKQFPEVIVSVEGHCDERGTREYNLALGERRATTVRNYLIALGVNTDRIDTRSYGKERPVCSDHDEACWSQNRRGVMLVN